MLLHLSGEVNYDMFSRLVHSFNNLQSGDKLYTYFTNSEGGSTDVAEAIVDFINNNKESIFITFYGEIFSAGMYVFLKATCRKTILPFTRGMFHFSWMELSMTENGKPADDYDKFSLQEMKKAKMRTIELLKETGFTDKEISTVKRGKDLYLPYDRMWEFIV